MNREERDISVGATHLFRYHKRIGFEAGWDQGFWIGIATGGFGMLAILFLIGVIHAVS